MSHSRPANETNHFMKKFRKLGFVDHSDSGGLSRSLDVSCTTGIRVPSSAISTDLNARILIGLWPGGSPIVECWSLSQVVQLKFLLSKTNFRTVPESQTDENAHFSYHKHIASMVRSPSDSRRLDQGDQY
jgi:hypothetical protein